MAVNNRLDGDCRIRFPTPVVESTATFLLEDARWNGRGVKIDLHKYDLLVGADREQINRRTK